jgi:hypothetical protein
LYRQSFGIDRKALGPRHRATLDADSNVASILAVQGASDEALSTLSDANENGLVDDASA